MMRSAPPAFALRTSDPPSCATTTSPESSAAIARDLPSIETSVTSRSFSAKMRLSFAYHCERLSAVRLLYATFIATGDGFGVADAAAVGALDAGAGAAPPPQDRMTRLAATIAARTCFVMASLLSEIGVAVDVGRSYPPVRACVSPSRTRALGGWRDRRRRDPG